MTNSDDEEPNIFRAAVNDDVNELRDSLSAGQRLDHIQAETGFTPLHMAIIQESMKFLYIALEQEFNPWIRDNNERLAIDHAAAWGMKDIQSILLEKMYPKRPDKENIVEFKPG